MVRPERLGRQRRWRRVRGSGGCAHEPEPGGSAREGAGPRWWGEGTDRGRRGARPLRADVALPGPRAAAR